MRFYFHKKSAPNSSPFKSYEGLKIRHFLAIWPFLGLGLGFATDFSQRIFQPFFSHFLAIFSHFLAIFSHIFEPFSKYFFHFLAIF